MLSSAGGWRLLPFFLEQSCAPIQPAFCYPPRPTPFPDKDYKVQRMTIIFCVFPFLRVIGRTRWALADKTACRCLSNSAASAATVSSSSARNATSGETSSFKYLG
jgi:hypothetical protein